MGLLHLLAGKLLFNVQVNSNQRERQLNRVVVLIRMLSSRCVDNVLMDKTWIQLRQCVATEPVIRCLGIIDEGFALPVRTVSVALKP